LRSLLKIAGVENSKGFPNDSEHWKKGRNSVMTDSSAEFFLANSGQF
jgi:hypothetical protein